MRCLACNAELTLFESTRKCVNTGDYPDLCNRCWSTIADDVECLERDDLRDVDEQQEEEDGYFINTRE
jgi:hypothetical protein